MAEESTVAETGTDFVKTITDGVTGYAKDVMNEPFKHLTSVTIGGGLVRRHDTGVIKEHLGAAALTTFKNKAFLGGVPLINKA